MTHLFNLEAKQHQSAVLSRWINARSGAAHRIANVANVANSGKLVLSSDNDAMRELFQPISSASGFYVTDKTAMAVSTVYACLSKLAGATLQLPIHHYKQKQDGARERVADSPLWWLLNEQPHPMWTAASWKEWIVRCVYLRGDQFTKILRSSANTGGRVVGFLPLHPDNVVPRLFDSSAGRRLIYDIRDPVSGVYETIDQDDMLHFTGFGFDGIRSISAIQHAAKQAVGNSLAGAEYMGRTIGEGAMPQIALEFAGKMSPEQADLLRKSFVATYTGVGARKLPLVLTEGGKVSELSISPVDMELLSSRKYEKAEICQVIGVPPIIIGESEKSSSWGTGIEQITIGFVKFTVKPMLCRWEEEINRKVFRNAGQYVEFELDGLLRGDSKAQSEVFKAALGGPGAGDGYMTVNEVRRLKNMPPITGGDELFKAQRGTMAPPTTDTNTGENQ